MKLDLNINPEDNTNHEKRIAINCILDHYKSFNNPTDEQLFNHVCDLWSLDMDLIQIELSVCIDTIINTFKKSVCN